jgi:hypothetical protein
MVVSRIILSLFFFTSLLIFSVVYFPEFISIPNYTPYFITLEKQTYLNILTNKAWTKFYDLIREEDLKNNTIYNIGSISSAIELRNFGLAYVNAQKFVVPFSIDYTNYIAMKKYLTEYCYPKYLKGNIRERLDYYLKNNLKLPFDEARCYSLYNYYSGREGYYFEIKCKDFDDKILINKKPKYCVKQEVLLFKDGQSERCLVIFC